MINKVLLERAGGDEYQASLQGCEATIVITAGFGLTFFTRHLI